MGISFTQKTQWYIGDFLGKQIHPSRKLDATIDSYHKEIIWV